MSMTIEMLAEQLQRKIETVNMPLPLIKKDYVGAVIRGISVLYGDTNRQDQFYNFIEQSKDCFIESYNPNLTLNQQRYVLVIAQIDMYKTARNTKSDLVGYTTNALSVTNADKPFANFKTMIDEAQLERRRIFYKIRGGLHEAVGIV